jgi:hypothetical protein
LLSHTFVTVRECPSRLLYPRRPLPRQLVLLAINLYSCSLLRCPLSHLYRMSRFQALPARHSHKHDQLRRVGAPPGLLRAPLQLSDVSPRSQFDRHVLRPKQVRLHIRRSPVSSRNSIGSPTSSCPFRLQTGALSAQSTGGAPRVWLAPPRSPSSVSAAP